MQNRCPWCGNAEIYVRYHDTEWGVPERDSRALFEKLILDGFQAGLSWLTILKKRDAFRAAFDGFDPEAIARYGPADVARLLNDAGIIRHRGKIEATIGNARVWLEMMETEPGGFSGYLWNYVDGAPLQSSLESWRDAPAKTAMSEALSKDLKKRGFKFCGPTIVYAFAQAVGMVNDHQLTCPRRTACAGLAR